MFKLDKIIESLKHLIFQKESFRNRKSKVAFLVFMSFIFQKDLMWNKANYLTESEVDGVKHSRTVVLCSHSIPLHACFFYVLRIMTGKKGQLLIGE